MATTKTSTKPKKPAGPVAIPAAPELSEPVAVPDGSEAYKQILPLAQAALGGATAPTYGQAPALAYQNILTGVKALTPHRQVLAALPAPFDLAALDALPAVAMATAHAASKVDFASPGVIRKLQETAGGLREVMLSSAVTLMKAGVLPAPEVRHIMKGRGPTDQAQDCVDLAALFTKYASEVAGKTPVTGAQVDEARKVGNQLLQLLKPSHAPRQSTAERNADVAARDALGAYLVAQHRGQMRRAAYWIWGDDFEDHVPALHSRARAPQKKEEEGKGGEEKAGEENG